MEIILRGTIEEITEACRKLGRRAKTPGTDERTTLPRKLSGFAEALDLMKRGFWVDWTNGDTPTGNWAVTVIDGRVKVRMGSSIEVSSQSPEEYFEGSKGSVAWFEVADPTTDHAHP